MPKTRLGDGLSIDRFIPPQLRHMFYKNPTATAKYAIHNGLDPYGFSTNGLVLYLPLWALKGSTFKSVDAYKHTATVTGALWRPDHRLFDGDDRITIPHSASLDTTVAITVAAWAYITTDTGRIGNKTAADGSNAAWLLQIPGGLRIRFGIYDSGGLKDALSGIDAIVLNTWYLITGTYDGTTIRVYANTTSHSPAFYPGDIDSVEEDVDIGTRNGGGEFINGRVGEFWIYNRALTAVEITRHLNVTRWRYQ